MWMVRNDMDKRFSSTILCLTRSCNLSCKYCVVPTIDTNDADESSLVRAIDIISKHSEFVVILGGEPTISPNIDIVIRRLKRNGTAFTMVSNGILLKQPDVRRRLIDAGLESITVSLDSYKTFSTGIIDTISTEFRDVSVNIMYDRRMIGKLLPLVTSLSYKGIWSIITAYIFFDDVREHWYYSRSVSECVLPREYEIVVDREMKLIAGKYDTLKIHNSKEYFEKFTKHAFDMSWHCTEWKVLFVNNDLRIQFCQDLPAKLYTIFDLDERLGDMERAWKMDVSLCRGCYINCYFDAEHLSVEKIRHT